MSDLIGTMPASGIYIEETCAGGDPASWLAEPRSELLQPELGEGAVASWPAAPLIELLQPEHGAGELARWPAGPLAEPLQPVLGAGGHTSGPAVQPESGGSVPVPESLGEALSRLQLAPLYPGYIDIMLLQFPGPLPDDATLLRFHEALREVERHQAALREADRITVAGSTAEGRDLAADVRRLQREHPGARAEWAAYCEEQANGIKDPLRHSVPSLREFLYQFDL